MCGSTAPDSSLVMSRRLAMNRLSRSDSSMIVASSSARSAPVSLGERSRSAPAAPSTAASGVFRSCEIEVSRAERKRSVSTVRRTSAMSSTRCTRSIASALWSISASSSRRWSGVSNGPGLSLSRPTTPTGAAAGAHRQEQALCAGQRVGAASGGAVVLPGPFRRREIGLVEDVLRRIAGPHRQPSRPRARAARPEPSASGRSGRRSPTERRRVTPTPASLRLKA